MESLYSSVQIEKKKSNSKFVINYYIINSEDGYGLKIIKMPDNNVLDMQEIVMNNVSKTIRGVTELIDNFIETNSDFTQIQYAIEDYAKINK